MRTQPKYIAAIVVITSIAAGLACRRSPEARAQEASQLVRAMHREILGAQKKVIAKFKAIPEADAIRLTFDKGFDGWAVSDKSYSNQEEVFETALIGYQKDAKEEALIGELRLYAKKIAKTDQEQIADYESRLEKARKIQAEGKIQLEGHSYDVNDETKKVLQGVLKIAPLQIEYLKESQKIVTEYEAKLGKLLN